MSDSSKKGIILFGHGARNAEYVEPFKRIQAAVEALDPAAIVELGFLELTQPSFEQAVECLVERGVKAVSVVPIFFAPGKHVLKDLPQLCGNILDRYPDLEIEVTDAVGQSPNVIDAMARFALGN